jgi:hypothetical protein
MFIELVDVNEAIIAIRKDAIWAVTEPKEGPCEILLVGGERSIKIDKQTAQDLRECLGV